MVLSLLVLVSMGWSLNYLQGPQLDIAIPLSIYIFIFSKFHSNDEHNLKPHDTDKQQFPRHASHIRRLHRIHPDNSTNFDRNRLPDISHHHNKKIQVQNQTIHENIRHVGSPVHRIHATRRTDRQQHNPSKTS